MADLNSGKKVVVVGHSQGNFYANNAYRHIRTTYPHYRNSIGIVSVATPANWVEGGGSYQLNNVYTTNPNDLVINLVRGFYPDTLAANAPLYDNQKSMVDHEFVETYLEGYASRIAGQVQARISSLEQPEKDDECKDPEEVPVIVQTLAASSVTTTSARLNGQVQSGKNVSTLCVFEESAAGGPRSCANHKDSMASSGSFSSGDPFYCMANDLDSNTSYQYRVCARQGERVSDAGVVDFKTGVTCGSSLNASGGSEGLRTDFGMGPTAGYAKVEFEAYIIPDMLEIYPGGVKIYSIGAYVSGKNVKNVYHRPSRGEMWNVRVHGNSNTGTAWVLSISCPQ